MPPLLQGMLLHFGEFCGCSHLSGLSWPKRPALPALMENPQIIPRARSSMRPTGLCQLRLARSCHHAQNDPRIRVGLFGDRSYVNLRCLALREDLRSPMMKERSPMMKERPNDPRGLIGNSDRCNVSRPPITEFGQQMPGAPTPTHSRSTAMNEKLPQISVASFDYASSFRRPRRVSARNQAKPRCKMMSRFEVAGISH